MTGRHIFITAAAFAVLAIFSDAAIEDKHFWYRDGQNELLTTLAWELNHNVAKNIILFIGDGLGVTTVTAARILKGQLAGRRGEEEMLSFDKFPHLGLVKTYSNDMQTADSAATATAFLSGVKTSSGLIGLDSTVSRGHCATHVSARVPSVMRQAITAGKSSGIVTTTRITHATPAAAYAYSADRGWEGDSVTPTGDCSDIAWQLIHDNPEINVLLGGGRRYFIPANTIDEATGHIDPYNGRRDGKNLIQDWTREKFYRNVTQRVVYNAGQLRDVDPDNTEYLLGLFSPSHMDYEQDRNPIANGQPSLAEMTEKAIQVVQKNVRGYFLLVEGGRIDHGHHTNKASRALHDTLAFDKAVSVAVNMTRSDDTLIVVTSDHSHVMTIAGYPKRGNPILGVTNPRHVASDGLPYTTLIYGNGPGYQYGNVRQNLSRYNTKHKDFLQISAIPLQSETHSGEDVPVYARGPMSHLFSGVHEQSYIAHALSYAACVGDNRKHCATDSSAVKRVPSSSSEFYPTNRTFHTKLPFFNNFIPNNNNNSASRSISASGIRLTIVYIVTPLVVTYI